MSVTFETELELAVEERPGIIAQAKVKGAARKKVEEDDLDDDVPAKGAGKKGVDDEDDLDDDDGSDVEDDDWDPDFDEFDVPKSRGGKGKEEDEEEDFKPEEDEDLKELDLFSDSALDDEEDDF